MTGNPDLFYAAMVEAENLRDLMEDVCNALWNTHERILEGSDEPGPYLFRPSEVEDVYKSFESKYRELWK